MQHTLHHTITSGTTAICYTVVFSRHRTLAMEVHPDGQVTVRAPQGCPLPRLAELDMLV